MQRISILAALATFVLVLSCATKEKMAGPLETGIERFESGDYAEAKGQLESALALEPESPRVAYYLGRTALETEDISGAVEWLEKAVALDDGNSDYHFYLGVAYAQKVQSAPMMEQAQLAPKIRTEFEKAVEADPANIDARMGLAQYYLNAPPIVGGSPEKAQEQLDAIKELDPKRSHMIAAQLAMTNKDYAAAELEYLAAIEMDPKDLAARMALGFCYQASEDFDNASKVFESILDIDPSHMPAMYQIGRTALFAGGGYERGIECLETYLRNPPAKGQPSWAHAHWRLGGIYEKMGDREMARKEYEEALAIDPDVKQAREALEKLDAE